MNEQVCPMCNGCIESCRNLCSSCSIEPENIQNTLRRIVKGAGLADKEMRQGDTGLALWYIEGIYDNANEILSAYEEMAKLRRVTPQ